MLYRISLPYATFGLVAENNIVVKAAPIAKWAIGKTIDNVLFYYEGRGAKVTVINKNN